jgi:hypothetical protein
MPPDGTAEARPAENHQPYLSVATWLNVAAQQLRDEQQHDAAAVLDRLVEHRQRTRPEQRRETWRRWELMALRRGLSSPLGGLRAVHPDSRRNAAAQTSEQLRSLGLYGPVSARVLAEVA